MRKSFLFFLSGTLAVMAIVLTATQKPNRCCLKKVGDSILIHGNSLGKIEEVEK